MSNITVQPAGKVTPKPQAEIKKKDSDTGFRDMFSGAIKSGSKAGDTKAPERAAQRREDQTAKPQESKVEDTAKAKTEKQEPVTANKPEKTQETGKPAEVQKTQDTDNADALAAEQAAAHEAGIQAAFLQSLVPTEVTVDTTGQDAAQKAATVQTVTETAAQQTTQNTDETAAKTAVTPETSSDMVIQSAQVTTTDAAQAKFDEMLAKAAQELGQGKAARTVETTQTVTEQADTEIEVTPKNEQKLDVNGEEIKTGEEAETAAQKPVAAQTTTKPAGTEAAGDEDEPSTEEKLAKVMKKNDEATLGLIQPKAPDAPRTEQVRETSKPAAPVRTPDQTEQIRTQVIKNLENDKMEFRMQLQPQELGKIDVKMVLEGGRLAVEIAAADSRSAELLSRQTDSLMASLKLNNIELSSVNVVAANENIGSRMDSQYNLNNFQNQHEQEQKSGGTGKSAHGADGQSDTDNTADQAEAPQRMLNYSV